MKHHKLNENIKLVYYLVNKFNCDYSDYDDLIQVGLIGLNNSVDRYKEGKGKFSTYASYFIIGEIKKYLSNKRNSLIFNEETFIIEKKENNFIEEIKKLNFLERKVIIYKYYEQLSQNEIAQKLNISQSKVSRLVKISLIKLKEYLT